VRYPALDVSNADSGFVLAVADDYSLAAVQEHASFLTLFFADSLARARANEALVRAFPNAQISCRDVDDEDWARRSQQALTPVAVGRLTITPPWAASSRVGGVNDLEIIIEPSTGFGTGHHATTRLCLAALQALDLAGATVIDVGTGSGVLALAARLLGAQHVFAIDSDADAVRNANDNLRLNPWIDNVVFECVDLLEIARRYADAPIAGLVLANLTGAMLAREAKTLVRLLRAQGRLAASGLLVGERMEVANSFRDAGGWNVVWEAEEDGWAGLVLSDS
jgi:ribosomal protein L11 methyltransferase